jgi:hypothetical protein
MSHVEPEHNKPQEGEEPDEPFPPITKEWLLERAQLEEAQEIGAGAPVFDPTLDVPPEIMEAAHKVANWATMNGFKRGWYIGPVADRAALEARGQ